MPYYHMMDFMIDWFPFMGFWTTVLWLVSIVMAYLVYRDAERRGLNGLLWGLPILIPWAGLIFLVVYLVMRDHTAAHPREGTSPEGILDERYARGELTREQYLQMRDDLRRQG